MASYRDLRCLPLDSNTSKVQNIPILDKVKCGKEKRYPNI